MADKKSSSGSNDIINVNGAKLNGASIAMIICMQDEGNGCAKENIEALDCIQKFLFMVNYGEEVDTKKLDMKNLNYTIYKMKENFASLMV